MANNTPNQAHANLSVELHRQAYNAAFNELGLPWYWDAGTAQQLASNPEAKEPVRHYLETQQPHLLKAYEADFLVNAIQATKARCLNGMSHLGT